MTTNTDIPHENAIALTLAWVLGWGTGALHAFVAMKGWEWFVADTFGWPNLSFIQAWGLFMLISFATHQLTSDRVKNENGNLVAAVSGLVSSVFLSAFYFLSLFILSLFL